MKRIIVVTFSLIIILGVCGCNMREEKSKQNNEIIEEMQDYLEDKYGYIDYEVLGFVRAGWDASYDLLNLSAKNDGDTELFCVKRYEKNDDCYCEDNYVELLIRDEFENMMHEYADKYFSEYKLYSSLGGLDSGVYSSSFKTFEDIKNKNDETNNRLMFSIFISENSMKDTDEFKNIAKKFIEEISNQRVKVEYRVIYINSDSYKNIQRENSSEFYDDKIVEFAGFGDYMECEEE